MTTDTARDTALPTWAQRWGRPGCLPDGRLQWEVFPSSIRVVNSGTPVGSHYSVEECLRAIGELTATDDPNAVARAYEIAKMLPGQLVLPPTTWVVQSLYLPDRNGQRFGSGRSRAIWSAHEHESDARLWWEAWSDKWAGRRSDYYTIYAQTDGVSPSYLRRPGLSLDEIRQSVFS